MQIINGDIIKLGEHILLCGDSTLESNYETILRDKKVQLLLTDPPYGVAYVESKEDLSSVVKNKVIQNDHNQTEQEYFEFSKRWLNPCLSYLDEYNSIYIFNSDKMLFALHDSFNELKIKFSQLLIWIKNNSVVGRLDYLPKHELIAYGWYGKHQFHRSKSKSVLFCPKPKKSSLHPTMKPISLLRKLILNSSEIGDYVLDPFGGSGSTLIACEQTKRKCVMIELDIEYCSTIIKRWEKLTNKFAEKL